MEGHGSGAVGSAFLRRDADGWATVGLSYGTVYPDADDLPVMREATREIVPLRPGDAKAHAALLVHLASRRATRWDGLFELVPEGDGLHNFYRRAVPQGDASRLSPEQLEAIAQGFVAEPSADQTLTMILTLLRRAGGWPPDALLERPAGTSGSARSNRRRHESKTCAKAILALRGVAHATRHRHVGKCSFNLISTASNRASARPRTCSLRVAPCAWRSRAHSIRLFGNPGPDLCRGFRRSE